MVFQTESSFELFNDGGVGFKSNSTVDAEPSNESLSDDDTDSTGNKERFDAGIDAI